MMNFEDFCNYAELSANLLTVALGFAAIYGFFLGKRSLDLLNEQLALFNQNVAVNRIKETLGKLDALNYDEKEQRGEIHALFGTLSGQIISLPVQGTEFRAIAISIDNIVDRKDRLSESKKRRICHQVDGHLAMVQTKVRSR